MLSLALITYSFYFQQQMTSKCIRSSSNRTTQHDWPTVIGKVLQPGTSFRGPSPVTITPTTSPAAVTSSATTASATTTAFYYRYPESSAPNGTSTGAAYRSTNNHNIEIVANGLSAERGQYSLIRPMLSAVENHYGGGPGRPYQHHFGVGQPGTSLQMPTTSAALSAAEFARPHPKPR